MMSRASDALSQLEVSSPTRIDVPAKGSGSDESADGVLRPAVQEIVPALQSGSLFGGADGVLVVDAHALLKAEAEVIAELLELPDPAGIVANRDREDIKLQKQSDSLTEEWYDRFISG